ncbi:MAG: hypothetical protein GDA39_07410 [Hyphomonadaceae bacterium]|nr:hypothetical protein [Hyphomonadaceae bacterium]MBC6412702.1 hypothetical protein [Hyphomonadaceae bacterium]
MEANWAISHFPENESWLAQLGAYGVGKIPVSDSTSLFGRAGVLYRESGIGEYSVGNATTFSYGGGIRHDFKEKTLVRIEGTVLDTDLYTVSVSIGFRF